ncbi:MAG: hypothetical protein DRP63_00860 [Planctomycetota bacterium]|nr:MAG: hypothetical protein DRP63_00860 [Planctomycetota bacterium]
MMQNDAQQSDLYLVDLLLELIRRWWKIALIGVAGALAGVGIALVVPEKYEATGIAVIAPPKFHSPMKPSILPVETYQQMLLTEGVLAEVLKRLPEGTDLRLRDLKRNSAVDLVEMGEKHAPALVLKMRLKDPQLAAKAVGIWLKTFQELAVRLTTAIAQHTEQFVREQFELARKRLTDAEKELHEFDAKHHISLLQKVRDGIVTLLSRRKIALLEGKFALARLLQEQRLLEERLEAHLVNGNWIGTVEGSIPSGTGLAGKLRSQLIANKERYEEAKNSYDLFYTEYDIDGLANEVSTLAGIVRQLRAESDTLAAALAEKEAFLKSLQATLKKIPETEKQFLAPEKQAVWEAVLRGKVETISKLRLVSEKESETHKKILLKALLASADVARLKERLSSLHDRLKKLSSEHAEKQALLVSLRQKQGILSRRLKLAEGHFVSLWKEFLGLQARRRELLVEIRRKEDEVKLLGSEVQKLSSDLKNISAQIHDLVRERTDLERQVDVLRKPYNMLKARVEEARLALAEPPEDVRIAVKPVPPDEPAFPQEWLFALVGGLLGVFGGGFVMLLLVAKSLISQGAAPTSAPAPSPPQTPPSQSPSSTPDNASPDSKGDTAP